ncbi:serine carboxypeptidase S28-domain-containing protein [Morchella snyderi]|nr:serine carboxypeptidase S28-domain-containing protein [Morchella snyderi]
MTALNITLPVDHNGSTTETFENRYWVDDRFWRPGGPIMLFDVGEAPADSTVQSIHLMHQPAHARANNALIIVWEHRFYGQSFPSRLPETSNPDQVAAYFRFLTIEQALEDVAVFARTFRWKGATTSPGQVPWVFVGGSYPGARAAWARKRNPDIWYAALASSAVVELAAQNPWYYEVQLQALRDNGFRACADDMVAMARWVDAADDAQTIEWIAAVANTSDLVAAALPPINTTAADMARDQDMAAQLGDMVTMVIRGVLAEYQNAAFDTPATNPHARGDLHYFCGLMAGASGNATEGVFGTMTQDRAATTFAQAAGKNLDRIITLSSGGLSKRDPWLQTQLTSWQYQVCTDFGNLLVAAPTGDSLYPRKYRDFAAMHRTWCVDSFNITAASSQSDLTARRYGGWAMDSSNTLFVDGEFDPWRAGSVNSQVPEAKGRPRTEVVPAAGEVMADTVFGMVVEGGAHCPDLGARWNTTRGRPAFELWNRALATWLPRFENHAVSNTTVGTGAGASRGGSRPGGDENGAAASRAAGVVFAAVMAVVAVVAV